MATETRKPTTAELISECIDRAPLDTESKTELLGDICLALAGWCPFCGLVFNGDHAQNECAKKRISDAPARSSEARPGVGTAVESETADEKVSAETGGEKADV